jgi:hypothetical protein
MRPDKMEIFRTGQPFEQTHALRHYSDLAVHFNGVFLKVQAEKFHAPAGRNTLTARNN